MMKNVLLIGMNFYDYEEAIIQELSKRGYTVYHFVDKPNLWSDHFSITRKKFRAKQVVKHQRGILKSIDRVDIDSVLVLVGRYLCPEFLRELRQRYENARLVLYLWDDIKRVENYESVYKYYDDIYSFDPADVASKHFGFLPLFYVNDEKQENKKPQLDLYSAMNSHSDREAIIDRIMNRYPNTRARFVLTETKSSAIKRRIVYSHVSKNGCIEYKCKSLSRDAVLDEMISSKAILDIQFPTQIGLTMRTFDTLSVKRKLITTNQSIKYYDFYRENNIAIIDRDNPVIEECFWNTPYDPIPETVREKYSLRTWVSVIFEGKKETYLIEDNPYGRY